ncbi:MAG: DUF2924 domain-containing protein [Alphaproteobacteria bacterium]
MAACHQRAGWRFAASHSPRSTKGTVTVTTNGFTYQNKEYSSLSTITNEITGSHWNGWLFFGLKNKKDAA